MNKQKIIEYLKEYKYCLDWIEIYNDKANSNMGMSYSHSNTTKTNEVNSDVESKVLDKDEKWEEYKDKKKYIKSINKVLDKLPDDERMVIEHEFNLIDNDYYSKFPVGDVPHADLIANMPFSSPTYYKKRKNAYEILKNYMSAVI